MHAVIFGCGRALLQPSLGRRDFRQQPFRSRWKGKRFVCCCSVEGVFHGLYPYMDLSLAANYCDFVKNLPVGVEKALTGEKPCV